MEERKRLEEELSHHLKESETASQLLDMVKSAERASLYGFIAHLNHEMESHIDNFYDIPLSCQFRVSEKKIDLVLNHNGYDIRRENLSGGEQDRLALVLTCALSTMMNSPFMIQDESVSSLDIETSEMVFKAMNHLKESKLVICIAHQMVEGHYDEIISLT